MAIRAFKHGDVYEIRADHRSSTYGIKDRLKAVGGQWKHCVWTIPASALSQFPSFVVMRRAKMAEHCHTPSEVRNVSPEEIERGWAIVPCLYCDSFPGDRTAILEVLE